MIRLTTCVFSTILALALAGAASATPITFQLDNVTTVGGQFPTITTYAPALPLIGSGNIDFGAGTGVLTLPDYSTFVDIGAPGDDSRIDISGWTQTITSIDGSGNMTTIGGGSAVCSPIGALGGLVCGGVAPTVPGWPAAGASSAVIDTALGTITVIDNSNAAAGTITQFYSYSIIPEPGTALLLGLGLAGLSTTRRR